MWARSTVAHGGRHKGAEGHFPFPLSLFAVASAITRPARSGSALGRKILVWRAIGKAINADEDRSAKETMPAGCHSANMLAANSDAYLASADLPGSARWYRICRIRKERSWNASSRHNDPDHKRHR
jgi:hypothetical protein